MERFVKWHESPMLHRETECVRGSHGQCLLTLRAQLADQAMVPLPLESDLLEWFGWFGSRRCSAVTRKGQPCRVWALRGVVQALCSSHSASWQLMVNRRWSRNTHYPAPENRWNPIHEAWARDYVAQSAALRDVDIQRARERVLC